MRRVLVAVLVLVGVLLIVGPVAAQQTAGNLTGRVLDDQKSAVPGATLTAKHEATGFTRTVTSDAEGVYRFTALPIGAYSILVELPGFSTIDRKGIVISVGQTVSRRLRPDGREGGRDGHGHRRGAAD